MNDWNQLETRLRSLTPRRPSGRLRSILFGRSRKVARRAPDNCFNWLAPVTACLLFLFVTVHQAADGWNPRNRSDSPWPGVATTLSNVSFAAYLPGSFHNGRNSLPADTFEWTKRVPSPSSIPSFPLSETNHLRR